MVQAVADPTRWRMIKAALQRNPGFGQKENDVFKRSLVAIAVVVGGDLATSASAFAQADHSADGTAAPTQVESGYASVSGLDMYYEIHGAGRPLVLLHGALMTIEGFGKLLPPLAETRQVIAIEQQAHGRTADIDRLFSYEQEADDIAVLLREIGIEGADFLGYSVGGGIALQVAIRHQDLVRKLHPSTAKAGSTRKCSRTSAS
jgi:hypothetical protein